MSNIAGASGEAYSGCWSVKLSPCSGSTLMQTVAVSPDSCYQFSYYLNCLEGEALAVARVEWLDIEGIWLEMGGEQIIELAAGQNWKKYSLFLPPIPERCAWARISFAARGGQVLLDHVTMHVI